MTLQRTFYCGKVKPLLGGQRYYKASCTLTESDTRVNNEKFHCEFRQRCRFRKCESALTELGISQTTSQMKRLSIMKTVLFLVKMVVHRSGLPKEVLLSTYFSTCFYGYNSCNFKRTQQLYYSASCMWLIPWDPVHAHA